MKLKSYTQFVNESNIIDSKEVINFTDMTPFSKARRPQSDGDITHEKEFINKAVHKFDEIFGTDYFNKFGSDFHVLTNDEIYFSKEVVEALSNEAMKPKVYMQFDLLKNKDESVQTLSDNLMRITLSDHENIEDDGSVLNFLCSKVPSKVNKEELYYRLFRKVGSEFCPEIIKEILETKTHYDLGGDNKEMSNSIQKAFLVALKDGMYRYQIKVKKGKFNIVKSEEFFKIVIENYLKSDLVNKMTIREDYINKRLEDWYGHLRTL